MNLLKLILNTSLVLAAAACGTDSGNPGAKVPTSNLSGDFVGANICGKLQACFGTAASGCASAIYSATGITGALGLNTTLYPDLSQAIVGVNSGALKFDSSKQNLCLSAISQLACGSGIVTNAFSVSAPQDFSQAYLILSSDSSCSQFVRP